MFSSNTSQVENGRLYVEDVFSTWLYTGNSGSQTITNGIDLAGKGGLVWTKVRNNAFNNILADTTRGGNNVLYSNSSVGNQAFGSTIYTAFGSTGYTLGNANEVNGAYNYASWTFREAPKFFDVVTYTGTGANRTIAHNLGVAPGCILIKRTNTSGDWQVYHRSNANTEYMVLNTTAAKATGTTRWNSTTPTATEFTVGTDATVNASGGTYVAYLFAHDATSDGIIQCGSYTGNGSTSGPVVNLGWEPQWLLVKEASNVNDWYILDNMRGWPDGRVLYPNLSNAEDGALSGGMALNATGFQPTQSWTAINRSGSTYIYIAIRRGPMKTPTLGTSVFAAVARAGTGVNATITSGIVSDLVLSKVRSYSLGALNYPFGWFDRLRGAPLVLQSNQTAAEVSSFTDTVTGFDRSDGIRIGAEANSIFINRADGIDYNGIFITYFLRRAPGFFDEVCYTGTGVARTVNHNLGVAPELMIVKARTATGGGINPSWAVYSQATGNTKALFLDQTSTGATNINYWNNTTPTSSVFSVFQADVTNASATNYVAYLFASAPGVSKVGSYTGNGSSQTINCGFAAGARFVMIKRTDSTGDWYVWDTTRGIVAGNDPYLLLNSSILEVTSNDTIDTDSSGFVVNQVAATNVNVSSATYIYLAIA